MPTPGLSLVGFLDQPEAINLLRSSCVVPDPADAALIAQWQAARAILGAPMQNAGRPDIQPIPAAGQAHMAQLVQQPWVQHHLQNALIGSTFQMIELDALLALQFNVDIARSEHHNGDTAAPPSTDEMFSMCLPLTPVFENVRTNKSQNSLLVTSKGMNFHPQNEGWLPTQVGFFIGYQVGVTIPLMHVVRHNGRCFLHNGFHRAIGLRRRGVTHAPCVFRDVADYDSVGLKPHQTFDSAILESADPPTVGHFAQGRAYAVQLKVFTRTLHVSWADHITTDD